MKEYTLKIDFNNQRIIPNQEIELVQNDYNSTKFNFIFDNEYSNYTKVFELKYPSGKKWIKEIINDELILANYDEDGNVIPILIEAGDYEFEVVLYDENSKLTNFATGKFFVRPELVNPTDEEIELETEYPILDQLIQETIELKNGFIEKGGVGKNYFVDDELKGEIFNDYIKNKAISEYSHAEGYMTMAGARGFKLDTNHVYTDDDYDLDNGCGKYYLESIDGIPNNTTIKQIYTVVLTSNYDCQGSILDVGVNENGEKYVYVDNYILPNDDSATMIHSGSYLAIPYIPEAGNIDIGKSSKSSGSSSKAVSYCAYAEGYSNRALGKYSHVEGRESSAYYCSHAEGYKAKAHGEYSHAEGHNTEAGNYSHAEGRDTLATGEHSHVEGRKSRAIGNVSHAEGYDTEASGDTSHAEGYRTVASGWYGSHAEGFQTIANGRAQHVQGRFNEIDKYTNGSNYGKYAHIVGNGTANDRRSNAHTIDWDGNGWFSGNLTINGTENVATERELLELETTLKKYTDNEIATFDFIKVMDKLPETGLSNRMYFVPKKDSETQDLFDEYVWINNDWEWIATKQIKIDLTNYIKKDETEEKKILITKENGTTETVKLVVYK